jgi:4-oxalocrotonate tautomerase
MPLVQISMLSGRTEEQKRALLSEVSDAVHRTTGAPLDAIRIWITEFEPEHYIAGGVIAADRTKT